MKHDFSIASNSYRPSLDYTLHFRPIVNRNGSVRVIEHSTSEESIVGITVDDQNLEYRVQQEFPSIIGDIIDLAVAIHATDRLAIQHLRQRQTRIHIVLPVRNPEFMNTSTFQSKLEQLLGWATGSRWSFDFQKRTVSGRITEQEQIVPIVPEGCEIALWSGGLDALAGLYTRLKTIHKMSFILFGTGSNDNVYARQEKVFNALQPSFSNRLHLCRVPIRFSQSNLHQKNKNSRARGVVFTLLGSACAYLMGKKTLYLYENGIGAINLPYSKSAVGLDHSRSVHPLTLMMVSDLVSDLLKEEFRVQNPFLFWTKAEMCKALLEDGKTELPPFTNSCDSPHRHNPSQCGYCSSCILRKQALAASHIEDKTRYVVSHGKKLVKEDISLHLRHMLAQVSTFRSLLNVSDDANIQWESLTRRFPELDDIVDRTAVAENLLPADMQKRLIRLYQTYVTEWDTVEPEISVNLLNKISNQQTSDDCSIAVQ